MTSPSSSRSATKVAKRRPRSRGGSTGGAAQEAARLATTIDDLAAFLDASPTPHHVVATAARRLLDAGFVWFDEKSELPDFSGRATRGFVTRGGALVAFVTSQRSNDKFRIVGAHTDSPGLYLKSNPEGIAANFGTLEVEVYGSPLLNSWLDRDLDIAGHVVKHDGRVVLFRSATPVARLAQLAIHLDRGVNDNGLVLDKHAHLRPVWTTGDDVLPVRAVAAHLADADLDDVATFHAQLVDHEPARVLGADASLLASGRLDNQLSCWGAIDGISKLGSNDGVAVAALFDHEEVGSDSTTGAGGPLLEHLLERLAISLGKTRAEYLAMLPKSACLSCDNAHAVHPNYQDRHDLKHAPLINRGVALKSNSNQRYATSATSAVAFLAACESAGVANQTFYSRNNMPCGSTIGPITATRLGIDTVDVGVPQLSMHSAREVCGINDAADLAKITRAFLRG